MNNPILANAQIAQALAVVTLDPSEYSFGDTEDTHGPRPVIEPMPQHEYIPLSSGVQVKPKPSAPKAKLTVQTPARRPHSGKPLTYRVADFAPPALLALATR